ncbi:MAG: hypothetical protein QM669_15770 [Siphonobacter sp.]
MKTRHLTGLSIFYVLIPFIVFISSWIRVEFAAIALACLLIGLWKAYKTSNWEHETYFPPKVLLVLLLVSLGLTTLSGAGELLTQVGDWRKHNLILNDLIRKPWPVVYTDSHYFCYYLAYYLVPALAGKLMGVSGALLTCFLWTCLGLWLACLWVYDLGGKTLWVIIGFLFSGNLLWLVNVPVGIFRLIHGEKLIHAWSNNGVFLTYKAHAILIPLLYDSVLPSILYIPQHVLGTWIVIGMAYKAIQKQLSFSWVIMAIIPLPLWASVAALGILPWAFYAWLRNGNLRNDLIQICAFLPGLLLMAFYLTGHTDLEMSGWYLPNVGKMVVFFFLNWGVYLLAAYYVNKQTSFFTIVKQPVFWLAALVISAGSFIYVGPVNDFGNRFALASFWMLWVGISANTVYYLKNNKLNARILMLLGVCLFAAQYAIKVMLLVPIGKYQSASHINKSTLGEINQNGNTLEEYGLTVRQYEGKPESVFSKYLMKPNKNTEVFGE